MIDYVRIRVGDGIRTILYYQTLIFRIDADDVLCFNSMWDRVSLMENFRIYALKNHILHLEKRLNAIWGIAIICLGLVVGSAITLMMRSGNNGAILRARGIILLDDCDRERILIGSSIPYTDFNSPSGQVNGLLILDDRGQRCVLLGHELSKQAVSLIFDSIAVFSLPNRDCLSQTEKENQGR